MAEKCPYAYKQPGTVSLLCEKQPGQKFPICGHQHLCGVTGQWENTPQAAACPLREIGPEMEWKKLTEEGLLAARDYVPLMEKAAFAAECAGRCFDRMEVRVEGGQVLPYFKENVERRSRYLMGGFVKLYLGEDFEPVEGETYLMSADDYDRWAGGHIFNQIDRMKGKGPNLRDKAFDLLADYRDLEKMLKTEIYGMLQAMNDPVSRFQDLAAQSMTPEAVQKTLDDLKEARSAFDAAFQQRKDGAQ